MLRKDKTMTLTDAQTVDAMLKAFSDLFKEKAYEVVKSAPDNLHSLITDNCEEIFDHLDTLRSDIYNKEETDVEDNYRLLAIEFMTAIIFLVAPDTFFK